MTQIEKILEAMKGKDKIHLSEIWGQTGLNKNSVMGLVNKHTKQGKFFKRLGDGYYCLLEGV